MEAARLRIHLIAIVHSTYIISIGVPSEYQLNGTRKRNKLYREKNISGGKHGWSSHFTFHISHFILHTWRTHWINHNPITYSSSASKCKDCVIEPNFVDFRIQCNRLVNDWIVCAQHSHHFENYCLTNCSGGDTWLALCCKYDIETCVKPLCSIQWINEIHCYWPMLEAEDRGCPVSSVQCTRHYYSEHLWKMVAVVWSKSFWKGICEMCHFNWVIADSRMFSNIDCVVDSSAHAYHFQQCV